VYVCAAFRRWCITSAS